jgi:signal transduction histidine kinase
MELSRMKSDFVSTVSHEFKSPLTSIRQIAEMLETGRIPSEERRQKYYEVLLEQSERLSLLTDNVLSFAKMEEGKREFVFEETDIKTLLMEIVSTIQDRVRHEGFTIELEIEDFLPPIVADVPAITQAVTNLIDNAVKYSGESKKVVVNVRVDEKDLVIDVRDFGVGIKKVELNKIFDRFYRGGDELTRTIKGSGLGLTLVKQIVEAHYGSIQVESELGKGSVFTVKLPTDPNKG